MIKYEKHILDNGLTVILHQDLNSPMALVNVLYNVGARDENPEQTGFAHLFEHLMFGGSINIENYDEPIQRASGENNAFTSNDITNYYINLPANNIETALWLESDRMLSLAFSEKSLEVQRNVVMEEFKERYLNEPYGDAWLLLRPLAYKVHPYQWPTIGKKLEHIADATLEDVKAFFKKFYCPANAILCIVSPLESAEILPLIKKWFEPIPSGDKYIRNLPLEPTQTEARTETVERDVPSNAIYKAWHMSSRNSPKYYAQDMLTDILSMGKSSRLQRVLVKEKKLFSSISCYVTGSLENGLIVLEGKVREGIDPKLANSAVDDLINDFCHSEIQDIELNKVKSKIESYIEFGKLQSGQIALSLSMGELIGNLELINTELGQYQAVSKDEVKAAAKEVFQANNCNTLFYLSKN